MNDIPYKHIFLVDPSPLIDFNYIPKDKMELVENNIDKQINIVISVISEMITEELNKFPIELLKNYDNNRDFVEFTDRLSNFYDTLENFLYNYSTATTEDKYDFTGDDLGECFNFFLDESTIICWNYDGLNVYEHGTKQDIELDDLYVSEYVFNAIVEIMSQFELCNIYIIHLDIWLPKIPINTYYIGDKGGEQ